MDGWRRGGIVGWLDNLLYFVLSRRGWNLNANANANMDMDTITITITNHDARAPCIQQFSFPSSSFFRSLQQPTHGPVGKHFSSC